MRGEGGRDIGECCEEEVRGEPGRGEERRERGLGGGRGEGRRGWGAA